MTLFSQRKGIKPVKSFIQLEFIDEDLRNSLWNVLSAVYWEQLKGYPYISSSNNRNMDNLLKGIWINYFKKPIDGLDDHWSSTHKILRNYFLNVNGMRFMIL